MIEAVNAGDFAAALDFHTDDVVLALSGDAVTLTGDGAAGKEAYGRWFADWFGTFEPGYRFTIDELRADGDLVYATLTHHARGRASGADVTMPSDWIYTFRDGKIARAEATGE